jgi:signal transduction histidine kinase
MSYPDINVVLDAQADYTSVWADPDKVQQVLVNLLENACKYASPRGIGVQLRNIGGAVEVSVSDHGQGIPEADLPLLFQQFFKSTEGRPSGTGLGLWISRGLIEAHGGTMTAESSPGVGSTFRFTLPQRTSER